MRQLTPPRRRSASSGFTLIEVLITMFVTAIGLLTVAGLQASAKKASYEATQRTVATALVQDMVERMRANGATAVRSNYVTGPTADVTQLTGAAGCDNSYDASANAQSKVCTAAEIAQSDLAQWGQKLQGAQEKLGTVAVGGLTNARGCVIQDGARYYVVVAWRGMSAVSMDNVTAMPAAVQGCGKGQQLYTDPATGVADALQRVIWVQLI